MDMRIRYYMPMKSNLTPKERKAITKGKDESVIPAAVPVVKDMGNGRAGLVVYDDENKAYDDFNLNGYDIVECDFEMVRVHATTVHVLTGKPVLLFMNCEKLVDIDISQNVVDKFKSKNLFTGE